MEAPLAMQPGSLKSKRICAVTQNKLDISISLSIVQAEQAADFFHIPIFYTYLSIS